MSTTNHSFHIEQRVLENLMHFGEHTNSRVQKVLLKLTSDCFFNPDNAQIFAMIKDSFRKEHGFNFVDILVLLGQGNDELHAALKWMMDNYRQMPISDSSFEADADKIITLSTLRKQLYIAERMIDEVKSCIIPEDAQSLLNGKLTEICNLNQPESKHGISTVEIAEAYCDGKISEEMKIPTMSHTLNSLLDGGFMPKSLIIVAAAPSVGKTGFSIYLLDIIARAQPDTDSLFFSIEMEYKHIWMRHVGVCAGKPFDKLNDSERISAITKSLEVPIKIYDTNICKQSGDMDFIITTSRLRALEKPISVIVVDYLGLIQHKGHFDRHDLKISDITRQLSQLAIELNCSVILLTQVNRGPAQRGVNDRCPWPHDAADSSGSHNNANYWFGADRPALYQDDPSYANQFVIKCRKNRFGETFDSIFAFNGGTFAEVEEGYFRKSYEKTISPEDKIFNRR